MKRAGLESGVCFHCSLAASCLPRNLTGADKAVLSEHVAQQVTRPRRHFCRAGQPYSGLYIVRTGLVKRYRPLKSSGRNFREIVVDFPGRGELVGLEGMGSGLFDYSAEALETCSLCFISRDNLGSLFRLMPDKIRDIIRMSWSLCTSTDYRSAPRPSEERLALFLLDIAGKRRRSGMSVRRFSLPMKRREIADHLMIATETLSRLLHKLERNGIVAANGKTVEIIDFDKLKAMTRNAGAGSG